MSKLSHSPGPCGCGWPDSQPAHTCPLTETDHPENVDPLCTCCYACVEKCLVQQQDQRSEAAARRMGIHVAVIDGCSCRDPNCPTATEALRRRMDRDRF